MFRYSDGEKEVMLSPALSAHILLHDRYFLLSVWYVLTVIALTSVSQKLSCYEWQDRKHLYVASENIYACRFFFLHD